MNRSLMIDLGKKKKTWMNFKDYKKKPELECLHEVNFIAR